jgi:hypothetical protein
MIVTLLLFALADSVVACNGTSGITTGSHQYHNSFFYLLCKESETATHESCTDIFKCKRWSVV